MNRTDDNRFLPAVVPIIAGLRAALLVYEQTSGGGWFKFGGFIWQMLPYLLCLLVWAKGPSYVPSVAGAAVAVCAELFAYYSAYTGRDAQSGLIITFMPLWSTLIFCPIAMYLARDSAREKSSQDKNRALIHHGQLIEDPTTHRVGGKRIGNDT